MKKSIFVKNVILILSMTLMFSLKVKAEGAGYTYDAATNVYTISQTSGNITAALTNALAEAQGTVALPATVRIQEGAYNVGLIKVIKSNLVLDARGATLNFVGSSSSGSFLLKATDVTVKNVTIKGGVWDGKDLASATFNFAGGSVKPKEITFDGCTVKGAGDAVVRISNGEGIVLKNSTFTNGKYGVMIQTSSGVVVTDCTFKENTCGLGMFDMVGENSINNCTVTDNTQDGIGVKGEGTSVTVNGGNYVKNGKNGISVTDGADMVLSKVNITNNGSNGISPVGSKSTATVINIKESTLNNNGRHGVAADSYVTITMSNCVANGNKVNGVILNKYCKSSGLTKIEAKNNGSCGILVQGKSKCTKIDKVVCNNNKKLGISVADATITISNSEANKNKKHGIFLSGTAKNTVTINKCTATENGNNGIFASDTTTKKTVVIKKTNASDNGTSGVESYAKVLNVSGTGNVFSGNKKHGLACRQGKMNIKKAIVTGNKTNGVYYSGSKSGGYCVDSTINNNQSGVVLTEGPVVTKISSNTFEKNKKYGICLYEGTSSKKTTLKECKKNTFISDKKCNGFIVMWEGIKVPSKLKRTDGLTIAKTVKSGKKKITGTATAGSKVSVKVNGKTYKATVGGNGKFTIKVSGKLKSGTVLKVTSQDKYKNKFIAVKKI